MERTKVIHFSKYWNVVKYEILLPNFLSKKVEIVIVKNTSIINNEGRLTNKASLKIRRSSSDRKRVCILKRTTVHMNKTIVTTVQEKCSLR